MSRPAQADALYCLVEETCIRGGNCLVHCGMTVTGYTPITALSTHYKDGWRHDGRAGLQRAEADRFRTGIPCGYDFNGNRVKETGSERGAIRT